MYLLPSLTITEQWQLCQILVEDIAHLTLCWLHASRSNTFPCLWWYDLGHTGSERRSGTPLLSGKGFIQ